MNKKNKPLVTVFIPVYNGEKFIGKAIKGILNQTFQDFKILIINDGSTDRTMEEINKYKDDRINIYENDKNRGIAYTRNKALELSKTKYLAINDADDFSFPERIETQVKFLEKNKEVGIVGAYAKRISKNKIYIWKYPLKSDEIKVRLFWGSSVINSTAMFNLSFLEKYKLKYDEKYPPCEDFDLFERAINFFPIYNLDKTLIEYLEHDNNLTFTHNKEMQNNSNRIIIRQAKRLIKKIDDEIIDLHCRLINYKFDFTHIELIELEKYFVELIQNNQQKKIYQALLFNTKIAERFFECVYHSNKKELKENYNLYNRSILYSFYKPSIKEKIKIKIKSI